MTRRGRIHLILTRLGVGAFVLVGCSFQTYEQVAVPTRPPEAPPNPTCGDWLQESTTTQASYAQWRLVELRAADGIPKSRVPTNEQARDFADEMTAECKSPDLGVSSLAAVSHDVYTAAFSSRRYLL